MTFYLSNHDVRPVGAEPAEFIDPPSRGDGTFQFTDATLDNGPTTGAAPPARRERVPTPDVTRWSVLGRRLRRRVAEGRRRSAGGRD